MKSRRHRAILWAERGSKRRVAPTKKKYKKIKKDIETLYRWIKSVFEGMTSFVRNNEEIILKIKKENDE